MKAMRNIGKKLMPAILCAGLAACGGSGGGDGDKLYTPTLPNNAAKFTAGNGIDYANAVLDSIDYLNAATSFRKAEVSPSFYDILRLATGRVVSKVRQPAGVAARTEDCDPSSPQGVIRIDVDETSTSADGTAIFDNCKLGILTLEGRITFDSTFNTTSGAYNDYFNGSLSFSVGADVFTVVFDITDSGNTLSGDYATNLTFSVDGIPGGGFLVTTTQLWTGNLIGGVSSGELIVYGGDNTRLRIAIIALDTADVDLDPGTGTFVDLATCTNLVCI